MVLPRWTSIVIIFLALLTLYLLWRLRKCKCNLSFVEKFEDKKASDEKEDVKDKDVKDKEGDEEAEQKEELTIEEEDKTKSETSESKKDEKKKTSDDLKNKKSPSMADKLLSYGEMQIFEGLKDNAYSLTDIKRMIREGEINEKMIEKFLARIEKMESGGPKKKLPDVSKVEDDVVEGFAGKNGYASAIFA